LEKTVNIFKELGAIRRELRAYVDTSINRIFGFYLSANSTPLGDADEVQNSDEPVKGEKSANQRPGRRIEPFGFRSRPPGKVRQLVLKLGSSNAFFIGIASDGGYGPTDLEAGETSIYSVEVPNGVHLTQDGDNVLASKTGRTVQINGSDYSLLKTETFLTDLATALGTIAASNGGGTILTGTTMADFITSIGSGDYNSTKAKNG
jgi:phage gp45-like